MLEFQASALWLRACVCGLRLRIEVQRSKATVTVASENM